MREILDHLRLPTTGPPVAPTPIIAAGEEAPWQDDVPELQQTLRRLAALRLSLDFPMRGGVESAAAALC